MDDMDSLLDSLMQKNRSSDVFYIDDKDVEKFEPKSISGDNEGMFAKQLLPVKDPICSLKYPTMMAIDADWLPTTCYHCLVVIASQLPIPTHGLASTKLQVCNGCKIARFCNRACQVASWHAYHKFECKIFKKLESNLPEPTFRAVLRAVLLKDRDLIPPEEWSRISNLTSADHIIASSGRTNVTSMAEAIKLLASSPMNTQEIQRLIFIMKLNAIELPTPIHGGVGVMLAPFVGKLNHSCEPNLSIHRPQRTMTSGWMTSPDLSEEQRNTLCYVVPLRDIQRGEELLTCYIVPTVSVHTRQSKLREDYFFECTCSKCQLDLDALTTLGEEHAEIAQQWNQWIATVTRHLSRLKKDSSALSKAAGAMDKSSRFLESPVLYTTGDYPQICIGLVLESLKAKMLDEALVNMLRVHFLVNTARFVGGANPTCLYTMGLVLDIFDVVLGVGKMKGVEEGKRREWLRGLEERGMSDGGVAYWRRRMLVDLRKRLEGSAQKDLLVLVEQREESGKSLPSDGEQEETKATAEQEMRKVLGLEDAKWAAVLEESGC